MAGRGAGAGMHEESAGNSRDPSARLSAWERSDANVFILRRYLPTEQRAELGLVLSDDGLQEEVAYLGSGAFLTCRSAFKSVISSRTSLSRRSISSGFGFASFTAPVALG